MKNKSYTIEIVKMSQLTPDDHNANKGTMRGNGKLEDSIRRAGFGRSGLLDKNGKIIAGNKFHAKAGEILSSDHDDGGEAIVVKSDGTKPIFVQRIDLDLDEDEKARMLAYYDNAVAQMDLAWDESQIAADLESGLPLDDIWTAEELSTFLGIDEVPYDQEEDKKATHLEFILKIECKDEPELRSLYDRFVSEGLKCDMEIE